MKSASFSLPRLANIGLALLSISASTVVLQAQTTPPPGTAPLFSAGVSYTAQEGQGEGVGAPKFPNIDLVFNLSQPSGIPIPVHPDELALYSEGRQVGAATGIRTFDRTGYGTTTVIALDANGALRTLTPNAVNLAVFTVVHDGVKQDTTAVTSVAEDFSVDLPFHPGPRHWKANAPLFPARGKSAHLYDGLLQATSLFNATLPRRRILLVIADGNDLGSEHTPLDLLTRAKSLGIEIDAIAIAPDAPVALTTQPKRSLAILQQLSLATGGTFAPARSGDELQQLIALHLSRVRATPVVEFQLSGIPADGQVHSLELHWLTGKESTPAFLTTPKQASSYSFASLRANPLLSNPWLLGFGGCFLLGLCLLLLSLLPLRTPLPAPQLPPNPADIFLKPPSGPYPASPPGTQPSPGQPLPQSLNQALNQPRTPQEVTQRHEPVFAPSTQCFDAPPQGPYARLVIRNNVLAGKIVPMTKPIFAIGTLPGNDLILTGDLTISGTHLRFYWESATLYVEDNHSTNGTWLNRQRLAAGRHAIKPGDEIGLGQTILIVERA